LERSKAFVRCGLLVRVLSDVAPTPEQLQVLETDTYRTCIIRGGAGSGKTTAAALRCRKVLAGIAADRRLEGDDTPIRLAVLTFNRTLKGYIETFIDEQVNVIRHRVEYSVNTFAGWAFELTSYATVIADRLRASEISGIWNRLGLASNLSDRFIVDEVQYVLGRFSRDNLDLYLACERVGRGKPTLIASRRRSILAVVAPYLDMLSARDLADWSDCAAQLLAQGAQPQCDVIIADEVQDFGVQVLRAMFSRLRSRSSVTFVLDTAQSIYPCCIEWNEVGLDRRSADWHRLSNNYRNSPQIAQFVEPLLTGLTFTDDGTIPDYTKCKGRAGRTPTLISGDFSKQLSYCIDIIKKEVDLSQETVGILTMWGDPQGFIGKALDNDKLPWCSLKQAKEWPTGPENIGVSSLNSAKGLEFDHVFVLGFDRYFVGEHGSDEEDYSFTHLRRILAMAITRAKRTVIIGYRDRYRSDVLDLLNPNTYLKV
jgi:superfamily I DNA/RNA helicase